MIEKWNVTIPPLSGEKVQRRVYVYIPDDNDEDTDQRYPVLYMFDGHNVFFDEDATYGKSWGLGDYLDENHIPLMVVAVECSHAPKNGRLSEYSPFNFFDKKFGSVRGRGKITMDWYVDTLKSMIDERYPTIPDREATFIAGSSMGGLMSLYALAAYPEVFGRAAALSPSIWVAPRKLTELMMNAPLHDGTVLYMDYGSREMANHPTICRHFATLTAKLMTKGVQVTSRIVPNGDHCEACWEEQLPWMISTLMYERE